MTEGRNLLYPRLDATVGRELIVERSSLPLAKLEALGATDHPEAAPAATGGHPVDQITLKNLQSLIRGVAVAAGYPKPLGRLQGQKFDRPCGRTIFEEMGIVPADAAAEGVWTFLTLVLVPEIAPWRFSDRAEDRLLGKPRNVLRRCWWRAWAFGPELDYAPQGCTPLGEDEFVQVMERPSIGGNQRTARAVRDVIWRAERGGLTSARSEFVREITRRLRGVKSHIALDSLTGDEFTSLLDSLADEANVALTGRPLTLVASE